MMSSWHAVTVEQALEDLSSNVESGLTRAEAAARLERHGPNRLAERKPTPLWRAFVGQLKSVIVAVLLAAAILAAVIGDLKDAIAILVVVLLNATLGVYQEHRAERAVSALEKLVVGTARVRREGRDEQVHPRDIVPGDIVLLQAGDRVPADGRVVDCHDAEVDEAPLTGESHPVGKQAEETLPEDSAVGDRSNLVFMNTTVSRGRLEMLVTETGMGTEVGRIAGLLGATESAATPLQTQLDALGRRLALIAVLAVSIILTVDLLRGEPLARALMNAIALAVAAIPEGLAAVVTVTLALGMQRMAKSHAIMRKLAAVETLGSTTVICSDKTGTLTLNQMSPRRVWFRGRELGVSGEGYDAEGGIEGEEGLDLRPLALPALLCNEARIEDGVLSGSPTEGALLALADRAGIGADEERAALPRIAELPFDTDRKLMATFHRSGDRVRIFVKGAPEVLLERAKHALGPDGPVELDDAMRAEIAGANERLAAQALRVLGLGEREIGSAELEAEADLDRHVRELTLVGLVGIIDPPRPEAREAIATCRRAGIQLKMITGDHAATAVAIARDVGITGDAVTGPELEAMSDAELEQRVGAIDVFARVSPEHKLRIVAALQANDHVVAMTGDGVNDAPALKKADIGIAMGITGSEVAKEAAAMVLADDNFASIVGAVREGRTIYDNIVKFVRFQLSTNLGAIMTVAGASLLGMPAPFTALQILWINLIMDGPPAMTLGVDPPRDGIMDDPPRPRAQAILTWTRTSKLALQGLVMAVGTLWAFGRGLDQGGEALGISLAFTTFVLFQVFNVFNARAEQRTALSRGSLRNVRLWLALAVVVSLQVLVIYWGPAQNLFRTRALELDHWLLATAIAASVLVVEELRKLLVALPRALRRSGAPSRARPLRESRSGT